MEKDENPALETLRLRRQAEERLREETPGRAGSEATEEARRLYHELDVHRIELELQNQELRQAKDAAEEALANFIDLYEFAPVGYTTLDPKGTMLAVNCTGAALLGEEHARLIGHPFAFYLSEGQAALSGFLERVFAGPGHQSCEITLKPKGKSEIYLRLEGHAANSGSECRVAMVDITDVRQEELFHLQLECVEGFAVYLLDNQGTVLNWNPGAERLSGYRAEEIIGKNFSCLYSDEDRNEGKPHEDLRKTAAEGRFVETCWLVRKDGSRFWADVVLTPLRDEKGHLWGFSKVTHDVTDRKQAEENCSFSEARSRALFEDNPTIIFTIDADWNILSANPMAISHLGYSKEELEGDSVLKLFRWEDRGTVAEQFLRCMETPYTVCHWEVQKLCKDGRLLWVEETAQATFGLGGTPCILLVCQDVTERKQAAEERERLLIQLEVVLENINEAVVITDLAANIVSMSRAALAMYGYRRGDLDIHRPLSEYRDTFEFSDLEGHPVSFEQWPLVRALRGDSFIDCELRVVRKDTGKSWIGSYNGSQVCSTSTDVTLAVVTVRDITERKSVEEALRVSEARFHAIFNLAAVGIAQVSLQGQWLLINQKISDILGYSFSELEMMTVLEISHPEDVKPHLAHIRRLLSGEVSSYAMEKRYLCKDGSILWVNLTVTLVRDQRGEPEYYIAIVEDINQRKKADQEITRLNLRMAERAAELETANQELEAFNYTVAHDLRQPLNIINSCCQVIDRLYSDHLEPLCKEHIGLAYKTTLRMDHLIEALINFSRMGHVEPRREEIDLGSLAREAMSSLKLAEPEREVDFKIAAGLVANGDPSLLMMVLGNLLGNAWKYTRMREKAVVEFGVSDIGGEPTYFVRDNGAGFDKEDAEKLFAPFQRLPGAEEQRGFGIGLATVERIIRRHGGKVWAEGEPGQGACFFFTLPAAQFGEKCQK